MLCLCQLRVRIVSIASQRIRRSLVLSRKLGSSTRETIALPSGTNHVPVRQNHLEACVNSDERCVQGSWCLVSRAVARFEQTCPRLFQVSFATNATPPGQKLPVETSQVVNHTGTSTSRSASSSLRRRSKPRSRGRRTYIGNTSQPFRSSS